MKNEVAFSIIMKNDWSHLLNYTVENRLLPVTALKGLFSDFYAFSVNDSFTGSKKDRACLDTGAV